MLRRPAQSTFAPGAYVFPGGAVDPADEDPGLAGVAAEFDASSAERVLPMDPAARPRALAYVTAALREVLEEIGLLLGGIDDVQPPHDDSFAQRVARARARLLAGTSFIDALASEGLRVAPQHLTYAARFITPEGLPRRFDTRFFVARAPDGQAPGFDGAETAGGGWYAPGSMLRFDFPTVMPPTRVMCTELALHESVDDAVAAFRARPIEELTMTLPESARRPQP